MKERHPKALYLLFTTELWERFSYYSMRTLLVLYLTLGLGQSKEDALSILAIYSGLVYFTPIIGGLLADRYLGQANAIVTGATLMFFGHVLMSFPDLFFWAAALLIVGNGFFKPNISILVGKLYPPGDSRRDSAFTIFYMGQSSVVTSERPMAGIMVLVQQPSVCFLGLPFFLGFTGDILALFHWYLKK